MYSEEDYLDTDGIDVNLQQDPSITREASEGHVSDEQEHVASRSDEHHVTLEHQERDITEAQVHMFNRNLSNDAPQSMESEV